MSLCYLLFDRCVNKADSHSTPHYSLVNPVTPHHQGHCSLLTSWWAVYCSGESDYFNGEIFVMQWYCSSFYTSVSNFSVEEVALNCWVIQRDSSLVISMEKKSLLCQLFCGLFWWYYEIIFEHIFHSWSSFFGKMKELWYVSSKILCALLYTCPIHGNIWLRNLLHWRTTLFNVNTVFE